MKEIQQTMRRYVLPALASIAVGCGGSADDSADTAAGDTATQEVAAAPQGGAAAPEQEGPLMLSEGDIDVYRRGREAEIASVREKAGQLKQAKSGTDSVTLMMALADERARQREASAAVGVPEERYRRVVQAVDDVLRKWQFAKMSSDMAAKTDTSEMTAEQKQQMRSMTTASYDGLPPQNVELVLKQAPLLDSLRMTPVALAIAAAEGR